MKGLISLKDPKYPILLKKIGRLAPARLYYKGVWQKDIFNDCLAVVGSRQMTNYGKRAVELIVSQVAAAGITVVSGFMYGIDAAAHEAALKAGGKTIAVMPCGIDLIHPGFQKKLYYQILENQGLIISEYDNNFEPAVWTYPQRNRIVAGLSKAVLIVEAAARSGSLITANFAKKFNRKIFVVPGPITSHNSKGIMHLLKQGCSPIDSAQDILNYYQKSLDSSLNKQQKTIPAKADSLEEKIIQCLQREAMSLDELVATLSIPASKLNALLSLMELKSLIEEKGNKYYLTYDL